MPLGINPVKHAWVPTVRDWPHSSFHRDVRAGIFPEDWAGDVDAGGEFGERWGGGREWNWGPRKRGGRVTRTLIAPYAVELCNRRLSPRIQATTIELVARRADCNPPLMPLGI